MKILLIRDNGSKHNLFTFKYGFQYVLPILILLAFSLSVFSIISFLGKLETQKDQQTVDYTSLTHSTSQQLSLQQLNKRLIALNLSVMELSQEAGIMIQETSNKRIEALALNGEKNLNQDLLETTISAQENQLEKIKSQLALKRLEDQALELFSDETNKILVISDFVMPVANGNTTSPYGFRKDPINGAYRNHRGIDVAAPEGTSVRAIANGFVTFIGSRGAYGKVIEINHSETLKSRYAHLNDYKVELGSVVLKGDVIGEVGRTGRVTGPHLHLEVWQNGNTVDPDKYLNGIKFVEK